MNSKTISFVVLPKSIKKCIFQKKICQKMTKKNCIFTKSRVKFCVVFEIMKNIACLVSGYFSGIFAFIILCLMVQKTHISNKNVLKF